MYCIRRRSSALRLRALVASVAALEGEGPGPVLVQPADRAGDRGLAAAGLADQRDHLALGHVEGHVVDDLLAAVEDVEPLDREDHVTRLVGVGVGHGADVDVPRADLADAVAADVVLRLDGPQLRDLLAAPVDHERAAVVEAAAVRTAARGRRAARDALERASLAQVRDRVEQRARVGVRGVREDRVPRPELGDLPGVHHRDPVGDVGDHGEVVGDVEGADAVGPAQLRHGVEHHLLGRHVETGGRLVEDQDLGLGQERHGQCDPLHLAARELVGVAVEELLVEGQADLGQTVAGGLQPRLGGADTAQLLELDELLADPDARVEGGGRVLRHVGDLLAAQLADLLPGQLEHVAVLEQHLARRDLGAGTRVVQQRGADGGLARAGLADQADDLAGLEHQVDVVDDVDVLAGQADAEVLDDEAAGLPDLVGRL